MQKLFSAEVFMLCWLPLFTSTGAGDEVLTPEIQNELLQKAERWGVPQPHPESKLVKIWVFRAGGTEDRFALGFVEPGKQDRALVGFDSWDTTQRVEIKKVPDVKQLSLEDVSPTSPFSEAHGVNFGLITGIQLLRRGEEKLGVALINKSLQERAGHFRSPFQSPAGEAPVLMLARSCLAAEMNKITSGKPDFVEIKKRMELLVTDKPALKSEALDFVLKSLQANVTHPVAPEGSVEKVIDDYLLSGGKDGVFTSKEVFQEAEQALILKGFEAIPALLKQRNSTRMTNHLKQGFNNFVSYPMTAGQVIDSYLQRFANNEFDSDWLQRQQGGTAAEEPVQQWWKKASALGEEEYVKQKTVVGKPGHEGWLSNELLFLAEHRYPDLLPGIARKLLKTTYPSWPVYEAIVRSDAFSLEQKRELLEEAINTNNHNHRNSAIRCLQEIDPALTDQYLLKLLKASPSTTKTEYWTDQNANLSRYVSKSTDLEVWQALRDLINRADLGMRMQLIDGLRPPHDAAPHVLDSFHEIYLQFRDDLTLRIEATSDKFSGPGAAFNHNEITMRDFLHEHWARWLKLKIKHPEKGTSPEEWKAYREAVGAAVLQHRVEQEK